MQTLELNDRKEIAPFIVFSIAVLIAFIWWKATLKGVPTHPPVPEKDKIIGTVAPDFTLPDLAGVERTLSSYRGSVVLFNVWATWCQPCVDEMPSLQKLNEGMKGKKFKILAASIDTDVQLVEPFMKKYGLSFTALLDPKGVTSELYETTGVPETFLINQQGVVVEKIVGPLDWSNPGVFDYLEKLLAPHPTGPGM